MVSLRKGFLPLSTCQFVKKNGEKCRRTIAGGQFCWQHTKGLAKRWHSLRNAVKVGSVLSVVLSGAGVVWWQNYTARKNVEAQIGKEIRSDLNHLSMKLEILLTKPIIYKEPDNPNGVAIDRLERAQNISLKRGSTTQLCPVYPALVRHRK
jgi:hypothetical protein